MRPDLNNSAWRNLAWMISAPLGLAAVMAPAVVMAANGVGAGFDAVVSGIESRYHVRATKVPFMGLISGVAGISTHGGVRGLHVAEIEHFDADVDGDELNTLVEERVGPGWQRIVRETGRSGREQSLIYVRPDGNRLAMLIVDLDGREMDVVQVSVNPDHLFDEMEKHRHHPDANEDSKESKTQDSKDTGSKDRDSGDRNESE